MLTTAGSVASAILVKGLSSDVTARTEGDASFAWDCGERFHSPARMKPTTTPTMRSAPATSKTFAARIVSLDSIPSSRLERSGPARARLPLCGRRFLRAGGRLALRFLAKAFELDTLGLEQLIDRGDSRSEPDRLGIGLDSRKRARFPGNEHPFSQISQGPRPVAPERDQVDP